MGFFTRLLRRGQRAAPAPEFQATKTRIAAYRRCRVEDMEARRLLAADLRLGAVYYDPGSGFDETPNTLTITWKGGAAGTELTHLVIDTDKAGDGLTIGDTFFDIAAGGIGAYGAHPFQLVAHDGFQITSVTVVEGGTKLDLTFSGFTADKKLVFTIDVDEMGFLKANSVAEGAEFEGSKLIGTFQAPHFYEFTGSDIFYDDFDAKFAGSGLNLPNNDYQPPNVEPSPVLTAGAIVRGTQVPLPSSISGLVFEDINLTNSRQPGEPGIAGVSLTLLRFEDGGYVDTKLTTLTDATGAYKFQNLAPGQYRVVETQPSGYFSIGAVAGTIDGVTSGIVVSPDIVSDIVLLGGQDSIHNDFAEARPARLSGQVYYDANNDCVMQPSEPGIAGVTITIERILGPGQIGEKFTVVTDAAGLWAVDGLMPGAYRVIETQPTGYLDGCETVGSAGGTLVDPDTITGITLLSGQSGVNYKFGEILPNRISGLVHVDTNGNCVLDPGEQTLAGVVLHLLDADNKVIATTTTGADGRYEFAGLPPGTYKVVEEQPAGYFDGDDMVGSQGGVLLPPDAIGSIVLVSGMNAVNYNFCELPPASLAGNVYVDDDNDGQFDPTEQGIAGVTLILLGADGTPLGPTTVTGPGGAYKFSGLAPGTYGVAEVQPAGYFDGLDTPGSSGGSAQNPGDRITGATLAAGVNAVNYNFGELRPASISGLVHADRNGDCIYQQGEPLLAGVVIELRNQAGAIVATTTTNAAGQYQFLGLQPGVYSVHEVQPAGYFDGGDMVGSAGGQLSGDDSIVAIALGSGVAAVDYNFCELEPASISGMVHADRNGDCIYQQGEPLLAGVRMELYDATGRLVGVTTTDAAGRYFFGNLRPGVYSVHEVQPAGYFDGGESVGSAGGVLTGNDTIASITLGAAVTAVDYNFCEQEPASITGHVHADRDGDCLIDPGEPRLAGVVIQLFDAEGGLVGSTTTNAAGEYFFGNLRPGVYTVRELQPAGYFDGGESVGSAGGVLGANDVISNIVLTAGLAAVNYDFCEIEPATISGHVHADRDGDCVIDAGEPRLAGVVVELRDADGQLVATTTTNAAGEYSFGNLRPGQYSVREIQPAGYFDGGDSVGSAGGTQSENDVISAIVLAPGAAAVNYDFCEIEPASLSGMVHVDNNGNCLLDAGESPLANVTIELLDAEGHVVATTTTDALGRYSFGNLQPGVYGVREIQPPDFNDGGDSVGSAGGVLAGNDLITAIPLGAGVAAVDYNFCEVVPFVPFPIFSQPIVIPELRPLALPPITPPQDRYIPPDVLRVPFTLDYGGGYAGGYTWHLSVIDAGRPRGDAAPQARLAQISTGNDPFLVHSADLGSSKWILGLDDAAAGTQQRIVRYGMPRGIPVTGDFNGDGITDVGFFYAGQWFIDLTGDNSWDAGDLWAKLGHDGDKPVTGDWDGDGKTDIGIFGRAWPGDPSAIANEPGLPEPYNVARGPRKNIPPRTEQAALGWRTMKRTAQGEYRRDLIDHVFHFGTPGDIPITGDFNGSGVHTIGLFHHGRWLLDADGDGHWSETDHDFQYGQEGDLPVIGDFNGDGIDELGVFRQGTWHIDTNDDHVLDARDRVFQLGGPGDVPVVGDWNGDGADEPGVYQEGAAAASE